MDVDTESAADRIRRLAAAIRAAGSDQPAFEGTGRGLVVAAGGARLFTNAYVLLHVLRNVLKSSLPAELWYFGQTEISPAMAALLEPLDARMVDANPQIAAAGADIRDGWQLKSFALAHSRFAEVLLLDADQVPIIDPAACFDWPEYLKAGAVFWPDIIDLRKDNAIWPLLGLEPRRAVSFESGQVLVDRRRHTAALGAALKLNEHADDVYRLIYGDKDAFLLAWDVLRAPYALVPHRPYGDEFMVVQRDFAGEALFQHRTNAKWQYGGEQRKLFGFRHEDQCLAALAHLEQHWSGHVFTAPDRSPAARAEERDLIAMGLFQLEASDEPAFGIELRPHAEIGQGRAPDRRHWWVEQGETGFALVLSSGSQRSYVLERAADHIWRGRRHRLPGVGVAMVPCVGGETAIEPGGYGLVDDLLRAGGAFGGHGDVPPRLMEALALLNEVIPGVRARLSHLAEKQSDPGIAVRLRALVQTLGEPPPRTDVDRSLPLETGYIDVGITE